MDKKSQGSLPLAHLTAPEPSGCNFNDTLSTQIHSFLPPVKVPDSVSPWPGVVPKSLLSDGVSRGESSKFSGLNCSQQGFTLSMVCHRMSKLVVLSRLLPKTEREGKWAAVHAIVLTRPDVGHGSLEPVGQGRVLITRLRRRAEARLPQRQWARLGPRGQHRRPGGRRRRGCAGAAPGESCG